MDEWLGEYRLRDACPRKVVCQSKDVSSVATCWAGRYSDAKHSAETMDDSSKVIGRETAKAKASTHRHRAKCHRRHDHRGPTTQQL